MDIFWWFCHLRRDFHIFNIDRTFKESQNPGGGAPSTVVGILFPPGWDTVRPKTGGGGRVSVQGVKSLGGYFACLCQGFEFYEVKEKKLLLFFKKKMEILLHFQ